MTKRENGCKTITIVISVLKSTKEIANFLRSVKESQDDHRASLHEVVKSVTTNRGTVLCSAVASKTQGGLRP